MENNVTNANNISNIENNNVYINKNIIIFILSLIIILSFLGINILKDIGDNLNKILMLFINLIKPIISQFLYMLGIVIDESSDIISDTSKTGIDIAHGTIDSIGDLLKDMSGINSNKEDKTIIQQKINGTKPDSTTNPIQKPITSNKVGWCLIDEYEGQRSCIKVTELDKCMSDKVYSSETKCLQL